MRLAVILDGLLNFDPARCGLLTLALKQIPPNGAVTLPCDLFLMRMLCQEDFLVGFALG